MAIYQVWAAPTCDSLPHFQAWAQFFGGGFTTIGWQAQTGHGEVIATGTGASYAFTNPVQPANALAQVQSYNYRGTGIGNSTAYVGGNTTSIATADVITVSGITYQCILSFTSGSPATVPASDTTHWLPLQFEIWKSNGSNTSSLPLYFRITYTTAGSNGYRILMSLGTGIDSSGNITNGVPWSSTIPTYSIALDNATTATTTMGEWDMAGDADTFRFVTCRNTGGMPSVNYTNILVVDRAKTSTGTDTDAYVYVGHILAAGGAQATKSCIILNPQQGGIAMALSLQSGSGWCGTVTLGGFNASAALMGSTPVCPIFPIVGYCANPLLGAVAVHHNDYSANDGAIIPVWTYAAVHSYMVLSGLSAAASQLDNTVTSGMNPAILWE